MHPWLLVTLMLAVGLTGCAAPNPGIDAPESLSVTSPSFQHGGSIPQAFTCDGPERPPQIDISGLPQGTQTVALLVEDEDAPGNGAYVHWVVWNAPASGGVVSFPEGRAPQGAQEGANSASATGYIGPCPPQEDEAHRYFFYAFAVDRSLELHADTDKQALLDALTQGHTLAWGQLMGTFER